MKPFSSSLLACLLLISRGASAQTAAENIQLLGMPGTQVQAVVGGLEHVRSPRRLASGATGLFRLRDAICEGMHFEQTFFFTHQSLEQMEFVLLDAGVASANYNTLLQSLRRELGAELASSASTPDAVMDTASWVSGAADVMLFRSGRPERPAVRLIIKQRRLPDNADVL